MRLDAVDQVEAIVGHLVRGRGIDVWQLTTVGYYYLEFGYLGVAGMTIAPTSQLLALQEHLIDAVARVCP